VSGGWGAGCDSCDDHLYSTHLGKDGPTKTDEFLEKFQKFMLQIFAIINASSVMYSGKKAQHDFPKMRGGGSKAVWNFSKNSSLLEMPSFPYMWK